VVSTLDAEALLLLVVAVVYVPDEDREPSHPREHHLPLFQPPPPLEKPPDPRAATRDLTSGSGGAKSYRGRNGSLPTRAEATPGGGSFFDTSATVVVGGEGGLEGGTLRWIVDVDGGARRVDRAFHVELGLGRTFHDLPWGARAGSLWWGDRPLIAGGNGEWTVPSLESWGAVVAPSMESRGWVGMVRR
jgi:hypothetical protein